MPMSPRLLRPLATGFNPRQISGLALWLDGADSSSLYTTDAGPVTAVSSPLDISGCQLWLDASDSDTVTIATGVSAWSDKSGNARNATQATGSKQPIYSNTINGRSVITFQGTDDTLSVANDAAFNGSAVTYFIVAKQSAAANESLFYKASATSGVNGFIFRFRTGTTAWLYQKNDNEGATLSTATNTNTDLAIYAVTLAASSQGGFVSGARQSAATVSTTYDDTGDIWIGSRRDIGEYLNGDVAEILLYDTALTTSQRASVEAYLAAKWGISGVHTPATATSDPVGYWGDKSGNGRHATQATAASRPTLGTQNGRKALVANGTSHEMALSNAGGVVRNKPGLTIIAALNPNTVSGIRTAAFWSVDTSTVARSLLQFNNAELRAGGRRLDADSFDSATGGTIVASQPIVAVARLDYANATATAYSNSVPFATDTSFLTAGLVQDTASQAASIMSSGGTFFYSGTFAELLAYDRALTDAERRRIELYLARKWGITLPPTATNPEAADWIANVYANGGTVSTSTANAVNAFCNAIDAAGIRDRFYRLNLFCGTGLNAALVPLYRGPSSGGTQYGNTTDTNNGPFGSGDYSESSGLTGNGTNQYLDTGLDVDELPGAADCHLSSYIRGTQNIAAARTLLGVLFNGITDRYRIYLNSSTAGNFTIYTELGKGNLANTTRANTNGGLMLASRISTTDLTLYDDAVSIATNTTLTAETTGAAPFFVFARNGPTEYYNGIMAGYSIGGGMSGAEVTAYYNAMNTFQTALGREQA